MKSFCREPVMPSWRRRQLSITELLRQARIVTDPDRLARLNVEAANRKARMESEAAPAREEPC
jgi:hypothetical protein